MAATITWPFRGLDALTPMVSDWLKEDKFKEDLRVEEKWQILISWTFGVGGVEDLRGAWGH